jgi:hypothetical protein
MNPERWRQIEQMCQEALDRESAERAAFLDRACAGDADLRREVESLVAQQSAANTFLEAPARQSGTPEGARPDRQARGLALLDAHADGKVARYRAWKNYLKGAYGHASQD